MSNDVNLKEKEIDALEKILTLLNNNFSRKSNNKAEKTNIKNEFENENQNNLKENLIQQLYSTTEELINRSQYANKHRHTNKNGKPESDCIQTDINEEFTKNLLERQTSIASSSVELINNSDIKIPFIENSLESDRHNAGTLIEVVTNQNVKSGEEPSSKPGSPKIDYAEIDRILTDIWKGKLPEKSEEQFGRNFFSEDSKFITGFGGTGYLTMGGESVINEPVQVPIELEKFVEQKIDNVDGEIVINEFVQTPENFEKQKKTEKEHTKRRRKQKKMKDVNVRTQPPLSNDNKSVINKPLEIPPKLEKKDPKQPKKQEKLKGNNKMKQYYEKQVLEKRNNLLTDDKLYNYRFGEVKEKMEQSILHEKCKRYFSNKKKDDSRSGIGKVELFNIQMQIRMFEKDGMSDANGQSNLSTKSGKQSVRNDLGSEFGKQSVRNNSGIKFGKQSVQAKLGTEFGKQSVRGNGMSARNRVQSSSRCDACHLCCGQESKYNSMYPSYSGDYFGGATCF